MDLNSALIWIIIIAFYAPLHFMLPVLFLFATGRESESVRKKLIRQALMDCSISMLLAFIAAIILAHIGYLGTAMYVLFLSMPIPFVRIVIHKSLLKGTKEPL